MEEKEHGKKLGIVLYLPLHHIKFSSCRHMILPSHNTVHRGSRSSICWEPNSRTTPNILKIQTCSTRNIINNPVTCLVTVPPVLLLPVPLLFPIRRGPNHRGHRNLLGCSDSATESSEGCCREFPVVFAAVLVSDMCGFIRGGEWR